MMDRCNCCGVAEFEGLNDDPKESLANVLDGRYNDEDSAFILITDPVRYRRGQKLINYIRRHKMGEVVSCRARKNPNTGRMLKAWLFSPNDKKCMAWFKKNQKLVENYDDDDWVF